MRAIRLEDGQYRLRQTPLPALKRGEALVRVEYAAMNRADLFQSEGNYPLPERGIPGLEFSGTIAIAAGNWKTGDRVCGIVTEGAFAEYVASPAATLLPVPKTLSLREAAAVPEAVITAWISLFHQARLKKGETALIHGGASGVGLAAIQMAKLAGATVFATAGTKEKCALCETLGATQAICYKEQDFEKALKDIALSLPLKGEESARKTSAGEGVVDVILDMAGGDYFRKNLALLRPYGRLCMIAFLRGAKIEANLAPALTKKLSLFGSMLRDRPVREKAAFARAVEKRFWPHLARGALKAVIDSEFPLAQAEKGLKKLERSLNSGKILLKVASL
jgi:putative PIG3 family NAD(P)H quinone oxidoreductase